MTKTRKPRENKIIAPQEYWVVIPIYQPFHLGGSGNMHGPCWFNHRFKVMGTPYKTKVKPLSKYELFIFTNPKSIKSRYSVAHVQTGGVIGHGDTPSTAVAVAISNLACTPDFDDQINKLGDVMLNREVETEKAFELLSKAKD